MTNRHQFPLPPRRPRKKHERVPLGRLFYDLFFHPQVLILLKQERWSRAFRIVTVLTLAGGVLIGVSKLPRLYQVTQQWASWFRTEVAVLTLDEGRLDWKAPETLPYTTRHQGWRIDFASESAEFDDVVMKGPEKRGLWISPEKVYGWWPMHGEKPRPVPLLINSKAWGVIDVSRIWPQGLSLQGAEFEEEARRLLWHAVPVLIIHHAVLFFFQVMFYTFVFALIPMMFRTPLIGGGFRETFSFYLFASIPPLVVAAVYTCFGFPFMETSSIFVLVFVAYLFMAFKTLRKTLAASESETSEE